MINETFDTIMETKDVVIAETAQINQRKVSFKRSLSDDALKYCPKRLTPNDEKHVPVVEQQHEMSDCDEHVQLVMSDFIIHEESVATGAAAPCHVAISNCRDVADYCAPPSIAEWEKHTKAFGSKFLSKFGFTGQLGAKVSISYIFSYCWLIIISTQP